MVAQIQRLRTELDARRSERITMDLIEWLISLDDTKVDYGYLNSEQFLDEFLWFFDQANRTFEVKREALRNGLLNTMTVDWSRNVLHELFLPLVADLSVPQLQLLRTIATAERPRRPDEQG